MKPILLLTLFSVMLVCRLPAQALDAVVVEEIVIRGNAKTKDAIILREIPIEPGHTVSGGNLPDVLAESRELLLNTGLFNHVSVEWETAGTGAIRLLVEVREMWYIFPVPVVDLADRNFNIWWVEQKRSLERITYGLDFTHRNFSGQNDEFKVGFEMGYAQKFELAYGQPYLNRAQTLGMEARFQLLRNREINYRTFENKQAFFREEDNNFMYERLRMDLTLTYRGKWRSFHDFALSYSRDEVDEVVVEQLNPDFFPTGEPLYRYFSLGYTYRLDYRDLRPYPMKGFLLMAQIKKDGLGIFGDRDALTLRPRYEQYALLDSRWSIASQMSGKYSFIRKRQPYNDNRAIGFREDVMRGYEYYLIDGLDMLLWKMSLRRSLIRRNVYLGKVMPLESMRNMPFRAFLSINQDIGFVNDPFADSYNNFSGRWLWGGGIGVDMVFFLNNVFRLEYSMNHLMEKGLFLRFSSGI
jgi:hypothetical protein